MSLRYFVSCSHPLETSLIWSLRCTVMRSDYTLAQGLCSMAECGTVGHWLRPPGAMDGGTEPGVSRDGTARNRRPFPGGCYALPRATSAANGRNQASLGPPTRCLSGAGLLSETGPLWAHSGIPTELARPWAGPSLGHQASGCATSNPGQCGHGFEARYWYAASRWAASRKPKT